METEEAKKLNTKTPESMSDFLAPDEAEFRAYIDFLLGQEHKN